jgi:hypothetical protein
LELAESALDIASNAFDRTMASEDADAATRAVAGVLACAERVLCIASKELENTGDDAYKKVLLVVIGDAQNGMRTRRRCINSH